MSTTFHETLSAIVSGTVILFQIAGAVCAIRAIMTARTPQAAIGWCISLIFFPYVAIPLFLVFGEAMFSGYILAGSGKCPPLETALQATLRSLLPYRKSLPEKYENASVLAEKLRKLPATQGNKVRLLIDAVEAFPRMFEAIASASHYVIVQFYIIRDDHLGRQLKQKLIEAAQRGIRVWLLFDGMGSKQLPDSYCKELRLAGVEVQAFITNRQFGKRFQINFRNHRKLVIADGRVAYIGGLNIGDEYRGLHKKLSPWRDTQIQIEGPAVNGLQLIFLEDWNYATRNVLPLPFQTFPTEDTNQTLFLITSDPSEMLQTCSAAYLELIRAAQRRLWIATPYLVPDYALRLALCHAALRGVDVRILLPQSIDHLLPWLSSFAYYPFWRQAGMKIYRYQGFMHQKVMLIDDDLSVIGSINMDYRSFMLNFEAAAAIHDVAFARDVERMLKIDFSRSKLENLECFEKGNFLFRFKVRLASLFSPEQ